MPEIYIPLIRGTEKLIPFHEIPNGSIYISSCSSCSRCLKIDSEVAVLLLNDTGRKQIKLIKNPSKAWEIVGQLTGVTVELE